MAKKANLSEVLKGQEAQRESVVGIVEHAKSAAPVARGKVAASRENKKHIGGYFDEAVHRQLKVMGAEMGMTTQEMLAEALNGFFQRHNKPTIA